MTSGFLILVLVGPLNLARVTATTAQAVQAAPPQAVAQHQAAVTAAPTAHCHNGRFGLKVVSHLTSKENMIQQLDWAN